MKEMIIVAVLAFTGCSGPGEGPLHFPAIAEWPDTTLLACSQFKGASETNRSAQASAVEIALRHLAGKGRATLTAADITALLGQPGDAHAEVLHYFTWSHGTGVGAMSFWFERGRLTKITQGTGDLMPKGPANQAPEDTARKLADPQR